VVPHPIQQNKVERTNIKSVVGLTRRRIVPIHHKPQLPTLIPTNHVPIVMHMGMMLIIASDFTHNYNKANHRTPMLIRAKRGKVQLAKGQPSSQLKANPTPWRLNLHE
jgi:hypothetical protein